MGLSLRQKSDLYRELAQLVRSGKPFPAAVQLLHGETRGAVKDLLAGIQASLTAGKSVGESFAAQFPAVSHLEAAIVAASDRTGRFDEGCMRLSQYYEMLLATRKVVFKQLRYPIFVLHLAVLTNGLPALALGILSGGAGVGSYLKTVFGTLILIYLGAFAAWLLASLLAFEGARRTGVDALLRAIPLLGKLRRAFALERFCSAYEMQLKAGVNVMDGLQSAGKASQSALVVDVVKRAMPQLRAGSQIGPLLSGTAAFPQDMVRAIKIGEETGELDSELRRLSAAFQAEASSRLETAGALFSKLLYFAVVGYVVYVLVQGALAYNHAIENLIQ